jgi:uncharacterized protein YjiS (DUF1127 family)
MVITITRLASRAAFSSPRKGILRQSRIVHCNTKPTYISVRNSMGQEREWKMISSTVARSYYSGSTLIDAWLVRAIAGRRAVLSRVAQWQQRAAGRRELMTLTDRDLLDIGITRSEAAAEASKPFWEP